MLDVNLRLMNWMQDAGFWILDAGYWMPDTGCRMPDVFTPPATNNSQQASSALFCVIGLSL